MVQSFISKFDTFYVYLCDESMGYRVPGDVLEADDAQALATSLSKREEGLQGVLIPADIASIIARHAPTPVIEQICAWTASFVGGDFYRTPECAYNHEVYDTVRARLLAAKDAHNLEASYDALSAFLEEMLPEGADFEMYMDVTSAVVKVTGLPSMYRDGTYRVQLTRGDGSVRRHSTRWLTHAYSAILSYLAVRSTDND